ncbi:DegT/DnrJ/EryC1/StrS family aminotransferase [Sphaerisporangium krabiense]|uniref:dTDP-4-amino-4,6-dideoxygalactose transaminase n=1 Tax=Sphaerisporangium krabiense TaxID=763782 RepID=A0A7W8ZA28_9ACTN|nr:DegT/DnrJ/EryC1/StrS family aminotransferase [Sphaerisporangium krabiense]MBB5630183.1 dTDP-4-amino-4,6-dideoxygalactose transaminase [Sphaerisporangium krabiense]
MIPLFKVALAPDAADRVREVIGTAVLGHGPRVEEFEDALRARVGTPHLATVNNGTSGLHLALRLATSPPGSNPPGDGDRGEVLTTALTFEATNWAILANGFRVRWVDVDPGTLNMDLDDLAKKISPATRAIMVVHWAGHPVDVERLARVLDDAEAAHGFRPPVIEDCAQAWGTTLRGTPLGNHGNYCVFSFHATKHLACGAGGMLVTPDEESLRRALRLRFFGIDRRADRVNGDYDVPEWGYNFYLGEIAAAIGLANLETVADRVALHRRNAAHFDEHLAGVPGLEPTARPEGEESSFWLYPVKVERRADFIRKLADAGIQASAVVRRNDTHTCLPPDAAEALPNLDAVHDRVVHVPVGWWLSEEDRAHVVATIRSGW